MKAWVETDKEGFWVVTSLWKSIIIARSLEAMKEFADTVTAMVAAEEERQERITKEEA